MIKSIGQKRPERKMYQVSRLPNGLTVATATMPHMASVSVGLWVGMGSRYEAAAQSGVCHFIEHMLFKGTVRRSPREISEAIEGIGGYLNAYTSEEVSCFHARVHHSRFAHALAVLTDMFLNSRFTPADVAKEREVIKEEIGMYVDQPAQHVQELLNATLWPDHPLGRPITGTDATLDRLQRRHLLDFLDRHYIAANTFIVAAGHLIHADVVQACAPLGRRFRVGPLPEFAPALTTQQAPRVQLCTKATEQTQLALGFRTCSRHDERRYAVRLLNAILGENMSSRLFQTIREDLGLAYSIYSAPSAFADAGDLVISAGLDVDNLPRVLQLILRELRRCVERPPERAELRRARDYAIGQTELSLESTDNQMGYVGEQLLGYGHVTSPEEGKRRLSAVRAADIQAVASEFLRPERLSLAVVSPLKSARPLEKLLRM